MADPLRVYYIGEDPYLSNIAPLRFRTHPSKWKSVYITFSLTQYLSLQLSPVVRVQYI